MKYCWTNERDEMLREGYRGARTRSDLSRVITRVSTVTGYPRYEVKQRAAELGISRSPNNYWSKQQTDYLLNHAGEKSMTQIAKIIGRTYRSVRAKVSHLGISGQLREGYSGRDLATIFGVAEETVGKWERRSWIARGPHSKFYDGNLKTFIMEHPAEYDLRRVDQVWFKNLVFGDAECYQPRKGRAVSEAMIEHRVFEIMQEREGTA